MTATVEGSCYCGAVRFEVELPPRFVAHCHCHNCRRAHGAGSVTWAGFADDRLQIVAGEGSLAAYHAPDTNSVRRFCKVCGSTLFFAGPRWPGESHVAVANLLDDLGQPPTAHAYADRAPDWCPITDELKRYGGESGTEELQ